ncbi:MAG: DUF58 domain-containing protein [Bdellovibrionales bacterium]|nr:DUF58 domain-containing protein [Bdellovibrionales bacterium]
MNIPQEILDQVAQLQLVARRSVSTLLSGDYRSAFHGSGMQFKEFRRYEPGDDIRHMSWTVTARTKHPTIKLYEEDRELNVLILIDVSGSSLFGSVQKRKIDMYAELLALLGLAAVKSKDNVGMLFFNETPVLYLPPRDTQNHVLHGMISLLQQPLQGRPSDLRPALLYAQNVLKNRSIVIVLSDFLVPDFSPELRMLAQRHELVLLHCVDDAERGVGLKGVYEVCDPETGDFFLLDANSKSVRQELQQRAIMHQHQIEDLSRKCKSDYFCLSVQDDYLQRLVHFFRRRGPARL